MDRSAGCIIGNSPASALRGCPRCFGRILQQPACRKRNFKSAVSAVLPGSAGTAASVPADCTGGSSVNCRIFAAALIAK